MVGVKIPRVGVKITQCSLTPGGQAAQGVKINCYTGSVCAVGGVSRQVRSVRVPDPTHYFTSLLKVGKIRLNCKKTY